MLKLYLEHVFLSPIFPVLFISNIYVHSSLFWLNFTIIFQGATTLMNFSIKDKGGGFNRASQEISEPTSRRIDNGKVHLYYWGKWATATPHYGVWSIYESLRSAGYESPLVLEYVVFRVEYVLVLQGKSSSRLSALLYLQTQILFLVALLCTAYPSSGWLVIRGIYSVDGRQDQRVAAAS